MDDAWEGQVADHDRDERQREYVLEMERQHGVVLRAIVHQGPLRGRLIRASQEALYKMHYYGNPTNYDPPPRTVSESYDDLLECGALEEEQQRDRMYMSASSVSSKGPPSLSHLLP